MTIINVQYLVLPSDKYQVPARPQRVRPVPTTRSKVVVASRSSCKQLPPFVCVLSFLFSSFHHTFFILFLCKLVIKAYLYKSFQFSTFLLNAGDPLLVEGHPGVPVGDPIATAQTSGDDAHQRGLTVHLHS